MALLKIVPEKTEIAFVRYRMMAFVMSGLLAVASAFLFFSQGLNFGIDFRGGTKIELRLPEAADLNQIRGIVSNLDFGDVKVQEFGAPTDVSIVIEGQVETEGEVNAERAQQNMAQRLKDALDAELKDVSYLNTEVVGPKVSGELVTTGTLAVVTAVILMLLYIMFRFRWQFSVGAILALVHDVILTIGMFSLTQLEFNLSIIAAILTIVGYSMNDTVVVYDRVRENLRKYKKMPLEELLDLSINDTLSRTFMTSITTLLALFSLYIFGGEVIRGFTFAMIWGVFIGTYSSIFIAAPLLLITGVERNWSASDEKAAARP